ncbi:MAG: DUF2071 domain-containing protein [Acidimicrobiia bacterium]|nr:DUF2071 domain-containing protein [Acidimicrobiia bacterium]MBT8194543.1 DUF2071 domain-containing protein [Acidimicrobiia bacterium]NNF88931.1 DUF2071 domain-containing protein [Acidimicrobiia bacterium]NNJ48203.1 DUF2071 domain-containing protein [Acidimicrobiia bacterium]RZV47416.1 MAG: DUF2071 domain-containing protein [Acidimicrobiia bacterium]
MDHNVLYPSVTTEPVARPVMLQGWRDLAYAHWPYDPAVVQRNLPAGLEVDTFDGRAWVGLVAFRMERIRLPGTPSVPYLGTFPETNVRTYVRGPDGTPGVWFDSLDVTRLLPVLVARASYRLPYMWSKMSIQRRSAEIEYTARRRWPGRRGSSSVLVVEPGDRIDRPDPLEQFLTARWGLFTELRSRLAYAPVDHPAWPLYRAGVVRLEDELVEAAGYSAPAGEPIVHYSPGVEVRIGLPRTVDR